MKKLSLLTAFFLAPLLFVTAVPDISWAGTKRSRKKEIPKVDTNDRISAIGLTSITVAVFSPSGSKQYKIMPATKITVNRKPATISNLATGMDVTVTTAADPTVAATIDAKSPK
jgi:hypothetical protein